MSLWLAAALLVLPLHAEPSALDREVAQVIDLFYDLHFEEALTAADHLAAAYPGHPAGPFYRSIVYYQRFLAEEPRNPETLELFEKNSQESLRAAESLLSSAPAQGHYYLGITHGFRGRVFAARKKYIKAIPEAKHARSELKAALELDPSLEDAYLGLGMFEYFTARLPSGAKPFAYLVGAGWGNREKGLEHLHRVAEKGGPARMEARSVLAAIYAIEKKWDKSEAYLAELSSKYPRNPLYRLRRIYITERLARWQDALSLSDPAGDWVSRMPARLRPLALMHARYRQAECLLVLGRAKEAEANIAALEAMPLPPSLRDFVRLRRANLLDLAGKRSQAEDIYRRLQHPAAVKLAAPWLQKPFTPDPKGIMPWLGLETPS